MRNKRERPVNDVMSPTHAAAVCYGLNVLRSALTGIGQVRRDGVRLLLGLERSQLQTQRPANKPKKTLIRTDEDRRA